MRGLAAQDSQTLPGTPKPASESSLSSAPDLPPHPLLHSLDGHGRFGPRGAPGAPSRGPRVIRGSAYQLVHF